MGAIRERRDALTVLIPSSSGLRLKSARERKAAEKAGLNPFFIRSAVEISFDAYQVHGD